jgi:hypothetical protein
VRWKLTVVPLLSLLLLPTLAQADRPSIDAQVKALGQRYNAIEEQLPRSVRYAKTEQVDGATVVTRAWFNGVGDPLKVAIERSGPAGRELTEYVGLGTEISWDGMFVVTRKEITQPDGSTQVEEARRYYGDTPPRTAAGEEEFGNGILLRELTKSARIAAGAPLDMSTVRNVTVDFPKTTQASDTPEGRTAKSKLLDTLEETAAALKETGGPEADPFADVTGDSERFRLIHATASPDGRYALAIGFEERPDWTQYQDDDVNGEEVFTVEDPEETKLKNYVVELATKRILGETGGDYKGTRRRYNHRECSMTWSPDSAVFVASDDDKWNYVSCFAGRIGPGAKLIGVADVGAAATQEAERLLKTRRRKIRGETALSITDVKADGTIALELVDQERSVPRRGDVYAEVIQTLKLRETPKGLGLTVVKSRLGAVE